MNHGRVLLLAACILASSLACGATKSQGTAQPTSPGYSFAEYALDQPASGPAIVAVDEDDTVWVAVAKSGKLARFMNGKIKLFDLPADSRPVGIAAGSKTNKQAGSLWIAASFDNKIIRFEAATGKLREYPIDGENSWPFNIAIGPDGSIWFTERASSRVGRLDPESGKVTHFDVPTPNAGPAGLGIDQKSGVIWFTESYADRIGSLDPKTGTIAELKMSDSSTGMVNGPAGLAVTPEGEVWFAKLEGKLGHIVPPYNRIELYDVPTEARRPAGVAVSASGEVWAVALDGNALIRYRGSPGDFRVFPLPTGEPDAKPSVPPFARTSRPFGIAADSTGNIWFSEQYTGQLGVLEVAPPSVEILSPRGTIRMADPLFTARSSGRGSVGATLAAQLDSMPTVIQHGRVDLRGTLPGRHVLTVTTTGLSGQSSTAKAEFDYAPGSGVLTGLFRDLRPRNPAAEKAKTDLIAQSEAMAKGDVANSVTRIRELLGANQAGFASLNKRVLFALLDYQLDHSARSVGVQILDSPPYFSPARLSIRKGDVVAWKYDPPSDGHSLSHELHGIEIAVAHAKSGTLRAGESFSYKFDASGEFEIVDTQHPDARAVVVVEK